MKYPIASGHPKSGCHMLVKAMHLLGWPCYVRHLEYDASLTGRHVFIKRDPRNVVVSWVRHFKQPVTDGTLVASMRNVANTWRPLNDSLAAYEGWLTHPGTLVVRFEDLSTNPETLNLIADYMGSEVPEDAWGNLPGGTATWTGALSDWRAVWTDRVDKHWHDIGGPALLKTWGYS